MVKEEADSIGLGYDKVGKVELKDSAKSSEKSETIKHHLLEKETRLKQAFEDLKIAKHHVLFLDGVDYRPEEVPYTDYLACVKGLGEAVWQLNTEFFGNIRDSKGRIKIVLLVRPDVFHKLNLYNANSRLRDNAVLLDWATTETSLKSSLLYEATGKYFSSQQDHQVAAVGAADKYLNAVDDNSIFRRILRTSFQKPRDVLTFIRIAKRVSVRRLGRGLAESFESDIVRNPEYTKDYSDYLLGEVRDYANFYMRQDDFFIYIKFFQYLHGKSEFSYNDFRSAYERFKAWVVGENVTATEYLRDPESLLQFFYDVNVIGYREDVGNEKEKFIHFSFRERTLTNIAPKIKINATLVINPGVAKALDIGLQSRQQATQGDENTRRRAPNRRSRRGQTRSTQPAATKQPAKNVAPRTEMAPPQRRKRRRPNSPKQSGPPTEGS